MAIILKDISADLSLRTMAFDIFKSDEFQKNKDVLIDFTDVKFMSRAFAHEFLTHKQNYKVREINMSPEIEKMFEIVKKPKIKSELIKDNMPHEIGMAL